MTVRTWVGRFTVADGGVEEEGAWLGSLIRQRPDDEPDELYVLVEPAGDRSREFSTQLVDVVAQLYSKDPLSLTGALTRSLKAAHEHLRDWNRKSLREHRVGAGASCLALRGRDAYLAQVGPSLAYVRSADGEFRRLEAAERDFEQALGVAETFEPRLVRLYLNPGDLVLLASTQLDDVAPPDDVRRILERGADDALSQLYLLGRGREDFSLVLLSCFEEADPPPDFLTLDGGRRDERADESPRDDVASERSLAIVGAGPTPASASIALGQADFAPRPVPARDQVEEIKESTAPRPAAGVRLRSQTAGPRYRKSTGNVPMPRFQVPKLAVACAIALALLVALVWWQLPGSVQESREQRFVALLEDARTANARAQATDDPAARRALLTDAQTALVEAEKIDQEHGELRALQTDVAAGLSALDAVFEVRDFTTLVELSQQVTGTLTATRAVQGGDDMYLLDAQGHRVLRMPLAGGAAPETVFAQGEPVGLFSAGRPLQLSWSAQTESLVIMDDQRQAFAYFPHRGTLPMAVRGADGWGSVDAIATSGGNLYVLDVRGNQVWRYLPGQGGFDSERTGILSATELANATELAVGQDVYILDVELGIRRFSGGTEVAFPLAGIDRPLVSPASIAVLPGSNRIVVADRGNKRIVVASADGVFLRQIVSPSFTDLRGVAVDEGTGTLYVLNGDAVIHAPFP
jgi:serine/threonine protein phosphatase PrpC